MLNEILSQIIYCANHLRFLMNPTQFELYCNGPKMNTQLLIEFEVFCQKKQDGCNGTCLKQKLLSNKWKRVVDREKEKSFSNQYILTRQKNVNMMYILIKATWTQHCTNHINNNSWIQYEITTFQRSIFKFTLQEQEN